MIKKILFTSFVALVLIFMSFTSVVGYKQIASNDKINSPLFNMSIKRAVNNNTNIINYEYLGKDKILNIPLPKRINYDERIDKIIKIIQGMDDIEYQKFVDYVIFKANQNSEFDEYNDNDIIYVLNQIREKQDISLMKYIIKNINIESNEPKLENLFTYDSDVCATTHLFVCLGILFICLVLLFIINIFWIPFYIELIILTIKHASTCGGPI